MHQQDSRDAADERHETEAQRIDRNWNELLQELRVTQTGVQVLGAFLVSLPFQSTFARLNGAQRGCYAATLLLALLTTVSVLAPVATHRIVFRHHDKDRLLRLADFEAKAGMLLLALTLMGALLLVSWFLFGLLVAGCFVGVLGLPVGALWLVLPMNLRRQPATSYAADR